MTSNKQSDTIRTRLGQWVESPKVQNIIIFLILINAITIGLDADGFFSDSLVFKWIDAIILIVFVLELLIKLYAFDVRFFKSGWNNFDFVIVLISIMPASGAFSIFRTLRVLRTLRLLKKIPKLRLIIDALLSSIPSIGWISALLMLVFYIFAVIGTMAFGKDFPEWFGSMGATFYTLFQVMTLESWSMGIARPVMEKFPMAALFFIPFILTASYTALNIFIAVVVNAMNEIHKSEAAEAEAEVVGQVVRGAEHLDKERFILNDNYLLEQKLEKLESDIATLTQLVRTLQQNKTEENEQIHN